MSRRQTRRTRLDEFGDFLTLADLAELLGLSVRTLQRLRRHSPELLPPEFRPLSRTARYATDAVRAWRDSSLHLRARARQEGRMTAMLLWGLVGLALGGLWVAHRRRTGRAQSADRVSPQTLARLRQAQKEDR